MLLAHTSDWHFGRISDDKVVDALVVDVNSLSPDVVVAGGDLTQRGRFREYAGATDLLARFRCANITVIPGNHDVYAWWFPIRRLLVPLARYRALVQRDLDTVLRVGNVVVVALNAAFGWTVKGGRFKPDQERLLDDVLAANADAEFKVLAVHHPIVMTEHAEDGDMARGGERILHAAADRGLDCVLDGHLHRSSTSVISVGGRHVVRCSAGTATSNRGRFEDEGRNLYSVIRFDSGISIEERVYDPAAGSFECFRNTAYERDDRGWRLSQD